MQNSISRLQAHLPADIYSELCTIASTRSINDVQLAHLLGNADHECAHWTKFEENLNYSAQGLANTWPSRYAISSSSKIKTPNLLANQIARNPEQIANHTYAHRLGNGEPSSGDGWKYRGRGAIMITGKDNYSLFDATVIDDILVRPELVASKYKLTSAFWFFDTNHIWNSCIDVSDISISKVGKKINGGTIGLPDRMKLVKQYYNILKPNNLS